MSQQVKLLSLSRDFENLLTEIFGATGQGLHQKVNSVEDQLPPEVTKKLRFIASVRNGVVHKGDVDAATLENIRVRSAETFHYLEGRRPAKVAAHGDVMSGVIVIAIVAAVLVAVFQ